MDLLCVLSVLVTRKKKRRCGMSVQKIKEQTFLHTCAFPLMDILLYVETHLDVVDGNSSLYRRTVSVEDHCETFLSLIENILKELNLRRIFQIF